MARKTVYTREWYRPKSATRVTFRDIPGAEVFWARLPSGKFHAVGFKGSANKPFINYTFATQERMTRYVTKTFADIQSREAEKKREREILSSISHTVKVGDIFSSSWGYDQTNVYFYQVVELRGARTAVLKRIAGERNYTGPMSGTTLPTRDSFLERCEPLVKRIQITDKSGRPHFKIASYEYAYPWQGEAHQFSEWH